MGSPDQFDEESPLSGQKPYTSKHPIPNIQQYREHRGELDEKEKEAEQSQKSEEEESKMKRAFDSVKTIFKDDKHTEGSPYPTANRNTSQLDHAPSQHDSTLPEIPEMQDDGKDKSSRDAGGEGQDSGKKQEKSASEQAAGHTDPKQKRLAMKKGKRDEGGREVTDPITHLPIVIRDSTEKDLDSIPDNQSGTGARSRASGGLSGVSGASSQFQEERNELQEAADGTKRVFPPQSFNDTKAELALDSMSHKPSSVSEGWRNQQWSAKRLFVPLASTIAVASGLGYALVSAIGGWLGKKVEGIWEDEVWDAARLGEERLNQSNANLPESTAWLNSLLSSVWPLINPDLFTSLSDMLEDVMQASLPRVIRMVSVDDLGQGSESFRILGVRWLPMGAAGQSVDGHGRLKKPSNKDANDRTSPGEEQDGEDSQQENNGSEKQEQSQKERQNAQQKEQEQQAIREGMEAEQGDFVNLEVAFAYRARSSGKSLKAKAKNAHLFLKFYLTNGVYVPVWVELRGFIATMRLRLQLSPDPPFFALCTLTFLGQPKAALSCVPLSKHLPNLMDIPFISNFVQTSIDAALAEYVAPKSLTLDLKSMLVGDDFKKNTNSKGVIVIFIKEAEGFKDGDAGFGPLRQGSSDAYVSTSWVKLGMAMSSTRTIFKEHYPKWHEYAYMLVSAEELNAQEELRLQLWDADEHTADDDLGSVEVDLRELMHDEKTKNRMCDRTDPLIGEDADEKMPGTLTWSVGYFSKTAITEEQLAQQKVDENINSKEDLKKIVSENAERKFREAKAHDETQEFHQQKSEDYKLRQDSLIIASPPSPDHLSGIISIQIHNIIGLQVASLNKRDDDCVREDKAEQSDDLPSSTCSIILNHAKIFKTRTKPKTAEPFFNTGTERFIRDWKNTEVIVCVHDSRERENDALMGIVYLPLRKLFAKRSQVVDSWPLSGGAGFGRIRISIVFRSIELQLPPELRGWDYGTLEITTPVKANHLAENLKSHRIKLYSNLSRIKMSADNGEWRDKHGKESMFLACRNRYAMPLVIEWRTSALGPDSTPAFSVFWLKDIPDEEQKTVTLAVWKGGKENLKRARSCCDYQGMNAEEQSLGEIAITLKFWRGLSGYHKRFAGKDKSGNMRDVLEALDTANDEKEDSADENSENVMDDDDDDSSEPSSRSNSSKQPPKPRLDSKAEDNDQPSNPTTKIKKKLLSHTNDDSSSPSGSDSEGDGDARSLNPFKRVEKKIKDEWSGRDGDQGESEKGIVSEIRDYKDHHKQLHRKHRGLMQFKGARSLEWGVGALKRMGGGSSREKGVETEV